MLNSYVIHENLIEKAENPNGEIPAAAVWVDLLDPSTENRKLAEKAFGIEIPTHEEMKEIELSRRFYEENGTLYMTAAILANAGTEEADAYEITFIIVNNKLVTIRYVEPQSFKIFAARKLKCSDTANAGAVLMTGLLDAFINRIADIIEKMDGQIDDISAQIFKNKAPNSKNSTKYFQRVIKELGMSGDLISKTQESLVSLQRLVTFLLPQLNDTARKNLGKKLDSVAKDIVALREHSNYLIEKVNFLLDATLGLINIQQNDIMKLFSIAAVCFVPSTIITGFYGMNFKLMPSLDWHYGWEFAVGLMAVTIIGSLAVFKRKGWF